MNEAPHNEDWMRQNLTSLFTFLEVELPLRTDDQRCGSLFDANGRHILTIDPESHRTAEDTDRIATLVMLAVNVHGPNGAAGPQKESQP
jgi:hypothetical protein